MRKQSTGTVNDHLIACPPSYQEVTIISQPRVALHALLVVSGFLTSVSKWRKVLNFPMTEHQSKDPLHGVTLEMMLTRLVEYYGWEQMGRKINIRCFNFDPSIKSSLQFLRRTPWARAKVEDLYLKFVRVSTRHAAPVHKDAEQQSGTDSPPANAPLA